MKSGKLFFAIAAVSANFLCCGEAPQNLPLPASELLEMIRGDRSLAKKIDFASAGLRPYIRERPGAAYYFALGLEDLGMDKEADFLLEQTFRHDTGIWRKQAGRDLAARMGEGRLRADSLSIALRYRQLYPDDFRASLIMMKALWLSRSFLDLLKLAEDFTARIPEGAGLRDLGEALLYRARAESGLNHPRFPQTIRRLFYSCPGSGTHGEAWREFFEEAGHGKSFPQDELAFFKAKSGGAAGGWAPVLAAYAAQSSRAAEDPVFLREYAGILQRAAGWRKGIDELNRLLPGLRADARLVCEEYLGKFHRLGGQYEKSIAAFQKALDALGNRKDIFPASENEESQKDRLIWYLLSSALRASPKKMLAALPSYFPVIEDPGYFSDLFESLASALVRARDWENLAAAYGLLRARGYEQEAGRCAFLLACAMRGKLYAPDQPRTHGRAAGAASDQPGTHGRAASAASDQPGQGLPDARALFEYAHARGEAYYRILAGLILEKDADAGQSGGLGFMAPPGGGESPHSPDPPDGEADAYLRGFLDFGLNRRAARAARPIQHSVSAHTLTLLAESEASEGRYIDALRLLQRAARRPGLVPGRRMLEALYPQAFAGEMRAAAQGAGFPPELFYGLVREESYFDPTIGSHAGAVGLAQLMPATAGEIALKLKMPSPRLTDPLTNLRLGAYYLQAQWERFGEGAPALAAYNAGATRARAWKKQSADLPGVLFAEALSLAETREYIRKVLVSAVHYGYLYYQKKPRQTVREIFKDFL
ncbi:MAG: lytic transglycosylase domain-containing protein [Spirochaetia bacterium]|jgi:soluble lytic murein transglycosylase-like protein|nr:lytic transglycosylase domain-containing protein [Spirochaetia bacterium]